MKFVPTTCPYCGTGCSFYLAVRDNKVIVIEPWHSPPIMRTNCARRGRYAHEFIHSKDRLTSPLIKRDGIFVQSSLDEAYSLIVEKFRSYKPEEFSSLASAKASNEDNDIMQKLSVWC